MVPHLARCATIYNRVYLISITTLLQANLSPQQQLLLIQNPQLLYNYQQLLAMQSIQPGYIPKVILLPRCNYLIDYVIISLIM